MLFLFKEIKNFISSKASQGSGNPTKIIKANINIITPVLCHRRQ